MLTRRDQLKLKDVKAMEKKKGKGGEGDKTKGTIKGKGKGKNKNTAEKPEEENPAPKRNARKRKEPEEVKEPPQEPEGKKKRAPPKPKAAAMTKAEDAKDAKNAVAPTIAPKAKSRAKAKAKAVALPVPVAAETEEGEEIKTSKKQLFQSDDEGDGEEFAGFDEREIMAEELLQEVKDRASEEKKRKQQERKRKIADTETSTAKPKAKAKGKPKSKPQKKVEMSPFTKKEVARRKKQEKEVMESGATEDLELQAIYIQHLKNVSNLTLEGVKKYLQTKVESKFDFFMLNAYWNRPACGTKCLCLGDGTIRKAPEISYFGKFNPGLSWNFNMALAYISASLMVSCHLRGVTGKDGNFRAH